MKKRLMFIACALIFTSSITAISAKLLANEAPPLPATSYTQVANEAPPLPATYKSI